MKITALEFVKGVVNPAGFPRDGLPEVAFLGRSNVGKSSLINLVTGRRKIARTSRTPGKTREINYFLINNRAYLVDLPGYGYAKVPRTQRAGWTRLIVHVLQQRRELRLIVHLIDSRHPPSDLDREAMALSAKSEARYLVVMTKCDKPTQRELAASRAALNAALAELGIDPPIIVSSATTRRGAAEILAHIGAAITGGATVDARIGGEEAGAAGTGPDEGGAAEITPPASEGAEPLHAPYSGTSTTAEAAIQPPPSSATDASAKRSQRPRRST